MAAVRGRQLVEMSVRVERTCWVSQRKLMPRARSGAESYLILLITIRCNAEVRPMMMLFQPRLGNGRISRHTASRQPPTGT